MFKPLTIWSDANLPPDAAELLESGLTKHHLIYAQEKGTNLGGGMPSDELKDVNVAFGQPNAAQLMENPALKFVQIPSAGYTRYDTEEFRESMKSRGIPVCNSSSVYADACAQQVLAFMLASARLLPLAVQAQAIGRWAFRDIRNNTRLLTGAKVLIVGYGAIGKRVVELLAPFHCEVVAIRRSPRGDEPIPCYSVEQLDQHLAWADEVVNILPANEANTRLFNATKFALMKQGAHFYNIGRGTTVDQTALIVALESGQVASAFLDVTDPEPLPNDHPLWSAPNCTITPHVAGGYYGEEAVAVELFLENLRRLEAGEPLNDRLF